MKNEEVESFLAQQFENILDVLWCAENHTVSPFPKPSDKSQKEQSSTKNIEKQPPSHNEIINDKPKPQPPKESVYLNQQTFKSEHYIKGDSLYLPKRQVLQKHRLWEKAFKPLKVERKYHNDEIIDIEKTVDFIAQTEIKQIVTIQPFPQQTKVIFHETRVPRLKRKRHHVYDK